MEKQVAIKKPINSVIAWSIFAVAIAAFLMVLVVQYGQATILHTQQQARFAVYEAQGYYGVRWLKVPGTKNLLVVPPAKVYKGTDGTWLLVNKLKPIVLTYQPSDLADPAQAKAYNNDDPTYMVRQQIVGPLSKLFADAKNNGHALTIRSAYRSESTQKLYYSQATVMGTTDYVAVPGQSEHQTGLAVDVNNVSPNCSGCDLDATTATWLTNNAYKYGFIVRYQTGKESITGYSAEPWHLRYVGVLLATKLQESGLTLEEFTKLLSK
jgi:D-alanyl-D-alanine carboxypeptidase